MERKKRQSSGLLSQATWIWLAEEQFPQHQKSQSVKPGENAFCVVELQKEILLEETPVAAEVALCADTKFLLYANGRYVGQGPVSPGGDFDTKGTVPYIYASTYALSLEKGKNVISVLVQLTPSVMTEITWGHGGFLAACDISLADGSSRAVFSDSSWDIRLKPQYLSDSRYQTGEDLPWTKAAPVREVIWTVRPSEIPNLHEEFVRPCDYMIYDEYRHQIQVEGERIRILPGAPVTFIAKFDKIYSGHLSFTAFGQKNVSVSVACQEMIGRTGGSGAKLIVLDGRTDYRCMRMDSIGYLQITVSNLQEEEAVLENLGLHFTHYPIAQEGSFFCSDEALNKIYEVGKWTLKICRQTIHLDSPTHQEPLACTGDYFIESLMNYFTFGDPRLTRFDIVRTAHILRINDGKMFHTSYSLILTQMVMDYYRFTGDVSLLEEVMDALHILMRRFQGYLGETGVLEHAPNYMFVDWVEVDEFNMHHPPKALGQTCLNAFYYQALQEMAQICRILGDGRMAELYRERAVALKEAFQRRFWVEERGLYCDGVSDLRKGGDWLPDNTDRQYFSQHANTLAVLYHLCPGEKEQALMEQVIQDKSLIQAQPYFMHYVLEALHVAGLFGKYGLDQIRRWKALTDQCDRGLKECWYGFDCDFSHAWGGTPTYQLPAKMLGFEMVEPGFGKIRLSPNLYGLSRARISMPTPFGLLTVEMEEGREPVVSVPAGIELCM